MTEKCMFCKQKDAVYKRIYSGERLCAKCFQKSIEDKTRATIAKYNMLKFDDKIAVAVSGGKDSLSLLHVLTRIEKKFPKASLYAITIDEGIEGYRDEALKIVKKNCEKLNVPQKVFSFKELYDYNLDEIVKMLDKKGNKLSPCSYCGVLRRRAINIAAREVGANKIATAHTLDDEVQTILINIVHGDPLRLARTKPITDKVHGKLKQRIKPFCEIPEKETTLYAFLKKIDFQSLPCPYASTALRNDIRTLLNRLEEKHPGTKFTIFHSIEKLRPALERITRKEKLKECKLCGEPTTETICKTCQMLQELKIL
jgi:uncharacterized protein (TIGR00269 family)